MTDKKISALDAASTPLAGTEVLPIVQSSTTRKVTAADIVNGRSIAVAAGTALLPSVSVTGDLNTGVWFPDPDTVAISTGGSERFRITSSGSESILFGAVTTQGAGRVQSTADSATSSFLGYAGSTNQREVLRFANTNGTIGSIGMIASNLNISVGGSVRFTITNTGTVLSAGVYNTTVGATNRDVFVDNTGLIGYVSSIRDSKTEIQDQNNISWLYNLNPVSFRYRKKNEDGTYSNEADGITEYGLIAEDVEQINPELCFYDVIDGQSELRGVSYSKLITPLLKAIQDQKNIIEDLTNRIQVLESSN